MNTLLKIVIFVDGGYTTVDIEKMLQSYVKVYFMDYSENLCNTFLHVYTDPPNRRSDHDDTTLSSEYNILYREHVTFYTYYIYIICQE